MLVVHGILRETDRGAAERADTGALAPRVLIAGPLAAVVSAAPDRELTAEDAVAHLDLLVALVARVPVLPMAFGTVVPDEDAVRDDVLGEAGELEGRLSATADVVELRVELTFDVDASVAAIADPEVRGLAERGRSPGAGLAERMALGQVVAERVAAHQRALSEGWTAQLAGVAERAVVLHTDEQVQRTAYLVRRDRLAEADATVGRLREDAAGRAAVEYVGPLPVYSFLDELADQVSAAAEPAPASRWGW